MLWFELKFASVRSIFPLNHNGIRWEWKWSWMWVWTLYLFGNQCDNWMNLSGGVFDVTYTSHENTLTYCERIRWKNDLNKDKWTKLCSENMHAIISTHRHINHRGKLRLNCVCLSTCATLEFPKTVNGCEPMHSCDSFSCSNIAGSSRPNEAITLNALVIKHDTIQYQMTIIIRLNIGVLTESKCNRNDVIRWWICHVRIWINSIWMLKQIDFICWSNTNAKAMNNLPRINIYTAAWALQQHCS